MQDGTHRMALASAPPVLVLHLKRLLPFAKVHTHVDAPLTLDLAPYMVAQPTTSTPSPLPPPGGGDQVGQPLWYTLFGVTEHAGGRSGGHYVMHGHGGDEWVTASDASVAAVSADAVRHKQAYMLWYAKAE
jgi:ubiquitin C-terminal hydrolase